jgi:hypothetical protein
MTRRLAALGSSRTFRLHASPHPAFDRMRFLFTMSEIEGQKERRRTGILLAGHLAFVTLSACAPNETDKLHRIRIENFNLLDTSSRPQGPDLVEPDGIEPTTSCLQSTRSPN